MKKVGRNDPCPCGSGVKFKKCCGKPESLREAEIGREVLEVARRMEGERQEREALFGRARPPVSARYRGYRFVAVGGSPHWFRESDVKTFPDFLRVYLHWCMGEKWRKDEGQKPTGLRHPLTEWMRGMQVQLERDAKGDGEVVEFVPSGPTLACALLAYDLYTVRDNGAFQRKILDRLRHRDHFQSARHELFVAAVCVRAGVRIEYEDDKDGSSRHPEFVAVDPETGVRLTVEAKSRRRPGVMGHPTTDSEMDARANVGRILREAMSQGRELPHVVFIDLNLPPSADVSLDGALAAELRETVNSVNPADSGEPDPLNLIVFTNHPLHYVDESVSAPAKAVLHVLPERPKHPTSNPASLHRIIEQVNRYGNIPPFFPKAPGEK